MARAQPIGKVLPIDLAARYADHRAALVRRLAQRGGDVPRAEEVCQDLFTSALALGAALREEHVAWLERMALCLAETALRDRAAGGLPRPRQPYRL